jgi:hypothetical protein
VAQQRKRLGLDVALWRILQGAAAVIALLLAGEVLLLGAGAYEDWLGGLVRDQTTTVTALEDKDGIARRLTEFNRSGAHPFEMFAVVGRLVPPGMTFVQATVEGGTRLQFDATTPNIGDISAFENALKAAPQIASVEVTKPIARPEGTTFSATIEFNGDAFAPPTATTAVTPPRQP